MASALIQSNSQSALIATLNSASGATVNPFEYSLSKRVPSHGVQWTKLQAVNSGATGTGSTLNFDLTKMGFTRSLCLQFDVKWTGTSADTNGWRPATTEWGFLEFIDRIDIESSSRRILTMTKSAMKAAYSDLNYEQQMAFAAGCHMTTDISTQFPKGDLDAHTNNKCRVMLPLLFSCFDNSNLCLATGFTEPIRVSITFASSYDNLRHVTANTAVVFDNAAAASVNPDQMWTDASVKSANTTVTNPYLIVEHRLLPNELEDSTIAANYSQGPLSQLVYDYEVETVASLQLPALATAGTGDNIGQMTQAAVTPVSVELKSTAVVTDIYFWAEIPIANFDAGNSLATGAQLEASNIPIPLESVTFKASGQTIVDDIPCEYIGMFSRRTMKDGFWGSAPVCRGRFSRDKDLYDRQGAPPGNPCYLYRIQLGMDSSKQYDSNGISLRELNAPTLVITPKQIYPGDKGIDRNAVPKVCAGYKADVHVVLRKLGLQTTDSSSGRVVSTLSN